VVSMLTNQFPNPRLLASTSYSFFLNLRIHLPFVLVANIIGELRIYEACPSLCRTLMQLAE
jgi:hypothetical protein